MTYQNIFFTPVLKRLALLQQVCRSLSSRVFAVLAIPMQGLKREVTLIGLDAFPKVTFEW